MSPAARKPSPAKATPVKKTPPTRVNHDTLVVRGAREHNLKNVDIELPRDQLIVFTGLSGSGKSSLAFDTIYAEGQRRYVESLSAYARQFLGQMDKPDVDFIEGLSPAISIDQKSASRNPRSTVGTITEIYDYLRLLYARIGVPHCPNCGRLITRQTPQQIVDRVLQLPDGTRFQVLAPVVRGRKGEYSALLDELAGEGYTRARVDGEVVDLPAKLQLERYEQHTIEVVVDRLVRRSGIERRLTDSLETALKLAEGVAEVEIVPKDEKEEAEILTFSEHLACNHCGVSFEELAPRNFSFNSPYGACEECDGLGTRFQVDPELVIADDDLSIDEGAISPWAGFRGEYFKRVLVAVGTDNGFATDTPWKKLKAAQKKAILYGTGTKQVTVRYKNRYGRQRSYSTRYEGVIPWVERRHTESDSDRVREQIEGYMRLVPCATCGGARLKPASLAVTIGGKNLFEVGELSITKAAEFFRTVELSERDRMIAERVFKEVIERIQFMLDVGLDYLTLNRNSGTLAGGEAQRIRLASQIGSGLVGVLYVLDEPSIGLHQRDNKRLIETLVRLRDLGNTVIVVEHDEETIRVADHVVDIGPGAGEHGGEILVSGSVAQLLKAKASITGQYLSGKREIEIPKLRREPGDAWLAVRGAREHNLQNIDAEFPLQCFVAVTGVSGSGKSTLVGDILHPALMQKVYRSREVPGRHKKIEGTEHLDKVINIDQSPIGRTPRSNPATYTGVFDKIRNLFSSTQEAKIRGYQQGRFSFNVKGGRCEACQGDGTIKIEMHFLPDVYVPCEVCKGARYNRDTLDITFKNKNIAEVLDMPIEEALEFFQNQPIARQMQTLVDVGLGYVRLGQPAPTLSGGEAQRVKLSTELGKRSTGRTIYILDEPTTGLHFEDVRKLLHVLQRLVDTGNTVLVIEHNLDVIKSADWIIDLGPEGGSGGGQIIAEGSPEHVAKVPESHTGMFLAPLLGVTRQPVDPDDPELWEKHAGWWQDGFTDGADAEYEEQIIPMARKALAGAQRVLDIGTGDGQIARMLVREGAELVAGIDPTRAQLKVARERGGGVHYARAAADGLPFPDASFDAVVVCLVFEHIADHRPAIAEIARVLAPGGRFVFFLNHPLLQAPNSGWVIDHILEEEYWRIGPYLVEDVTNEELAPGVILPFVHRPLSQYVNAMAENGLLIERMEEPMPPEGFLARADEYRAAATIPRLLLLVATCHNGAP